MQNILVLSCGSLLRGSPSSSALLSLPRKQFVPSHHLQLIHSSCWWAQEVFQGRDGRLAGWIGHLECCWAIWYGGSWRKSLWCCTELCAVGMISGSSCRQVLAPEMPEPSEFGALPAAGMILFNILLQVSMEERDLLLPRLSRPGGCQKVSGFVS